MPIDLTGLFEAILRSFLALPTPIIAAVLLGSPTAALIAYRFLAGGRRVDIPAAPAAAALWVCRDCRSANQLRMSRCYRCGRQRDETEEIEFIIDRPVRRPATFEAPAGSPFAARNAGLQPGPGVPDKPAVPVMRERVPPGDPRAVGPGRDVSPYLPDTPAEAEPVNPVEADT